jgi:hypothetical protein
VSAIRVIYTQSGKFYYICLHRFSTISLIIGISGLSFVTPCGNSYMKSISITYKSFYKQILYFGLPGVWGACSPIIRMCPQNADDWSSAGYPDWDVRIWIVRLIAAAVLRDNYGCAGLTFFSQHQYCITNHKNKP